MSTFIEARVIQKIDTEQGWNANELILYKGEIALVGDPDKVYNIKVGNGVKKFRDLPYMVNYVNGLYTGIITPQSQVPSGVNNVFLVSEQGAYTNFGNVVLPKDNLGIIYKNGNNYTIQLIPIVSEEKLQKYIDEKLVNSNIGFGGEITSLAQSPNVQGMYIPKVSGVYPNFGNLEYNPIEGFTIFLYKDGQFSKIVVPLNTVKGDIEFNNNVLGVSGSAVEKYAVKKINTIAELKNTVGEYEGQIITLLGYYNPGDKELLNYKWTNTQGVDDGGSVINSSNGSWIALFNNSVNVLDFGAEDNLENQKVPFQKAVDYLSNIGGGILNIPSKTFRLSHLNFFGKKYSNISIIGINSTIIQFNEGEKKIIPGYALPTYSRYNASDGVFLFDAQVSNQTNDSESIKNIKISGINFISDVVNDKFDELYHQICMHGVSDVTIDDCSFNGFLGDGLAICRGVDNDGYRNAYNKNIQVLNCNFDGINKDNRQGISFYYCDGFEVDFCDFKNICRLDMIGAIDVEADDSFTKSQRGIISNNKFYNIGGMGAIVIFQRTFTASTITHNGYIITNNDIENVHSPLVILGNTEYLNYNGNYAVVFDNNRIENSEVITDLRSAYGVMYKNNYFKNITSTTLTTVRDVGANNILFEKNSFEDIKSPSGLSFIGDCKNINIISNLFNKMNNRCILVLNANGISNISNNTFENSTSNNCLALEVKANTTALELEYAIIKNNRYIGNIPKINLYFFVVGNTTPTTSNLKPKHVLYGNSSVFLLGHMPADMLGDGAGYVKLYREKGNPSNYDPSVYMELFPVGNNGGKTWRRQAINNTFEEWSEWREV